MFSPDDRKYLICSYIDDTPVKRHSNCDIITNQSIFVHLFLVSVFFVFFWLRVSLISFFADVLITYKLIFTN